MMDGKKIDYTFYNWLLYGRPDPDDLRLSQEQVDSIRPKLEGLKGKIIISGTGGEDKGGNDFKELWNK